MKDRKRKKKRKRKGLHNASRQKKVEKKSRNVKEGSIIASNGSITRH